MSSSRNQITCAVRRAIMFSAMAAAGLPAMAQDQAASAPSPVQEVVVTGSRIQSPNMVSASPITTVTATDIQQTGLTRTEDILNNLPQVFAGQGSTLSNASDGTATIDLHALGPQRTLVLVNSRRLGPGAADGRNYSDVNQIPTALIERIDVLTGGASATYGADAVSGVVNFVLNTKFQGVKFDANYAMYMHDNHESGIANTVAASGFATPPGHVNTGFNKEMSLVMGSNFADNTGNATAYITYTNQAAVAQNKFDYSACTLQYAKGKGIKCGGSGTTATGTFLAYDTKGNGLFNGTTGYTIDPKTGVMRPEVTPNDLYNYGPLNYYERPSERWTAGSFLNYDLNSTTNVYSEFMFTKYTSTSQIAPSGDFGNVSTISCADPLLTAQERSLICSPANLAAQGSTNAITMYILRRNVEGGPRRETFNNTSYHATVGVKGEVSAAWTYDVFGQFSTLNAAAANQNYLSNTKIVNALNVVTDPATGQPVCQSVLDGTDKKCVPWNIWVPGGVTAAATNYLAIPLYITAGLNEYNFEASATGDLGKYGVQLPTASNGMQVNVGMDWREDSSHYDPDYESILGEAAGGAGPVPPVAGEVRVWEGFTEVQLPLVEHKPFAEQISFDAGYRYSSYNLGFDTNTYKLELDWAPVKDLRFRTSFNRAVRAPNIAELFTPNSIGPGGSTDPCWGPSPSLTQAQCALTGLNPALYGHIGANPANQFNTQTGGNAALKPEVAKTFTFGLVFQPEFIPGLTGSIDYYDIKINDAILSDPASAIILSCGLTGSATACADIHRGTNGSLWLNNADYVNTTNLNAGMLETKDLDFKTHYGFSIGGLGKLALDLQSTYMFHSYTQLFAGGPTYDCVGYAGVTCGGAFIQGPLPHYRHTFSTDWATPWAGLDLNLRWRLIGPTTVDAANPSPLLYTKKNIYPGFSHIAGYNYVDFSAAMPVTSNVSVRLGVNNVLDKDPPTVLSGNCPTGACNGNTWSQVYDVLGRYVYAHVTAQF